MNHLVLFQLNWDEMSQVLKTSVSLLCQYKVLRQIAHMQAHILQRLHRVNVFPAQHPNETPQALVTKTYQAASFVQNTEFCRNLSSFLTHFPSLPSLIPSGCPSFCSYLALISAKKYHPHTEPLNVFDKPSSWLTYPENSFLPCCPQQHLSICSGKKPPLFHCCFSFLTAAKQQTNCGPVV